MSSALKEALDLIAREKAQVEVEITRLTNLKASLDQTEAQLNRLLSESQLPSIPLQGSSVHMGNGYPRTSEAVLVVLKGASGKGLPVAEIVRRAKTAGLLNPGLRQPEGSVLEALKRLSGKQDSGVTRKNRKRRAYFRYQEKGVVHEEGLLNAPL